ncbi:hypothetical protein DFH08DRAFT_1088645 [Mycena albidolilacea]|uniref:Uncharacterized protein n=1 Tax=Mycena albidolilacea TaxID=1033008 RepID=A0AAD6Z595_9AGAR|nr:hypothetical protein DFH08DRAFT_1088645 [Mycena albidolilacea]
MDALASTVACGSLGYAIDAARRVLAAAPYLRFEDETDMCPLVRSAVQSALATFRAQHKKGAGATPSEPVSSKSASISKPTPQSSKSSDKSKPAEATPPTHAPPELSSFARKKSSTNTPAGKADGKSTKASILAPAQQLAMAAAREDAVQRYRALKASRRAAGGGDRGERGGGAVGEVEGMSKGRILKNWNTASSLYESTFDVSLGIVELQIQDEPCPTPVNTTMP